MSKIALNVSEELSARTTAFYGKPISELEVADIALVAYLSGLGPSHMTAQGDGNTGTPIEVNWSGYPIKVVRVEPGDILVGSYKKTATQEDIRIFVEALRKLSKSSDVVLLPEGMDVRAVKWPKPDLEALRSAVDAMRPLMPIPATTDQEPAPISATR